ncbi:Na+/H+ antiporter [Dyadobacter arcticus]|uniref:CPA1 family monovalent cation:H+ antiporter n=1 Tax=Dyadobacter arcticus TaxID=1078754 RepID=A0ABX0UKA2_9BACT|nr:Na+/H+ antiporter [Dyadobacter arcticus]NIJ53446.1 CPA1 family monovalent cation:H+ antiporter [Dyadobacter arcticus]
MIQENLLLIISLLFVVSMLTMVSEKIGVSYPIFLVIAGLLISFIPGMPHMELAPDLVFLIFLPPLLYMAAWNTSWKDFWNWKRPILMLSIGLVVFTATAVAYLSHAMIPGFTLAMGFVLGGVISPPDAVAATSVLQSVKVPKRVVTILEGESLVNDASSLIVFRVALATVATGKFVLWKAGIDFFTVSIMGIVIGLAIGHILYFVHRFFPTTPSIDTALTFITPYLMYIAAEHFHFSGVLAVVSGGLFLSFRAHEIFSYQSRMQATYVWETVIFLLNGIVFIMIGLQLPKVMTGLGTYTIQEVIFYSIVISVASILIRIIWVFPATYLPRLLFKSIREKEKKPSWKTVFVVAWAGMRGVVSLASALSIPLILNGASFPHRNLILFITFVVILFTLVLQGLSLPVILRWLNIEDDGENLEEQNAMMNSRLATVSLDYMQSNYDGEIQEFEPFRLLKDRYEKIIQMADAKMLHLEDTPSKSMVRKYRTMLVEIIDVKRVEIQKLRRERVCSDELIKIKERELDLEEARLRKSP